MRILLLNNQHYRKGGAHVVYFNTAELLKKHGHEVFFFSLKDENSLPYKYSSYFPNSVDFRKLNLVSKIKSARLFLYKEEVYNKLNEFIRKINPDIAHLHLFMGGLTNSAVKALKDNGVPIVHTVHDYRLICPAYTFLDKNNNICEKCRDGFFLRCAYRKCSLEINYMHSTILSLDAYYRKYIANPITLIDSFIFVSDFAKEIHLSFNKGFKGKSYRIYNFNINNNKIINYNKGDYFFYYGRLSREKGIRLLIEIAKELNLKLKIAGTGPLLDELLNNTNNNIEVLGFKKGEELWDLVRNSSFVVVPSEWYENNPLTIIESFSLGKPVIGSKIGGITELLQNERGILFKAKSKDSLKKALLKASTISQDDYLKYAKNAHDFSLKEFSDNSHYNALIKVYNSTIDNKKNG